MTGGVLRGFALSFSGLRRDMTMKSVCAWGYAKWLWAGLCEAGYLSLRRHQPSSQSLGQLCLNDSICHRGGNSDERHLLNFQKCTGITRNRGSFWVLWPSRHPPPQNLHPSALVFHTHDGRSSYRACRPSPSFHPTTQTSPDA